MKKGTIAMSYVLVMLRNLKLKPKSHIQAVRMFDSIICRPEGIRAYPKFLNKSRHIDVRIPLRNRTIKEVEIL